MTEVWKVVREVDNQLKSAIVYDTDWGKTYAPGVRVEFDEALGLAFDTCECAKDFLAWCNTNKSVFTHRGTLQLWSAEAEVVGPVKDVLDVWKYLANTPCPKEVHNFWVKGLWKKKWGWRYGVPDGTVACKSITLLEKCDG